MKQNKMKANINVNSIQQAIEAGYSYVIAKRDHYRGNGKGEVYRATDRYADICLNHYNMDDRGIYELIATDIDVIVLVKQRRRILNLINIVQHSMSTYSALYTGLRYQYLKHKMVYGHWRKIMGLVEVNPGGGAINFDAKTFGTRHIKMLDCLNRKLRTTDLVSSTYSIYE